MRLRCMCCGFEREFRDGEEAFQQGWDAPPHFADVVCCDLCPASYIVLGMCDRHARAHEKWKISGRPSKFEIPVEDRM